MVSLNWLLYVHEKNIHTPTDVHEKNINGRIVCFERDVLFLTLISPEYALLFSPYSKGTSESDGS